MPIAIAEEEKKILAAKRQAEKDRKAAKRLSRYVSLRMVFRVPEVLELLNDPAFAK
jgi:hypothetical protein